MKPKATNGVEQGGSQEHGSSVLANAHQTLIEELEATIAGSKVRQRADVLRRITDQFVAGSSQLSPNPIFRPRGRAEPREL